MHKHTIEIKKKLIDSISTLIYQVEKKNNANGLVTNIGSFLHLHANLLSFMRPRETFDKQKGM